MPSRHAIALLSSLLQITELRRVRSSASLRPLCHTQLKVKGRGELGTLNRAGRGSGEEGETGTKGRRGKKKNVPSLPQT